MSDALFVTLSARPHMLWPVRMCYGRCTLFRTRMSGFRRRWILGVSQRGLEVKCEELGPHTHIYIYIYIYTRMRTETGWCC